MVMVSIVIISLHNTHEFMIPETAVIPQRLLHFKGCMTEIKECSYNCTHLLP